MGLEKNNLKVDLTVADLKKSCYWIVSKFNLDNFHQQQNSSRSDLIGGFFDRWINKTPESLIFNKLLENKSYTAVNDYFFYTDNSSKNAPDIIGLNYDDKYYKFAVFNDGEWEIIDNTPFIEMKTFRESQNLITIPETQFDKNHFYVIVESHIKEDYLISIFENSFFDEENFNNIRKINEFIKSDNYNQLKDPNKLEKTDNLGYYELLGIYTGEEINDLAIVVGETNNRADKPRYLSLIEYKNDIRQNKNIKLDNGLYYHQKENGENNVPFNVKILDDGIIVIKNLGKSFIDVKIRGEVKINNETLRTGTYRLNFKVFDRSSKKREVIVSKETLSSSDYNSINKLIDEFDKIIND